MGGLCSNKTFLGQQVTGPSFSLLPLDEWVHRSAGDQVRRERGDIPALERRVRAAQLHEEFMLQVQRRLLKERCWLVVESHSPDMRGVGREKSKLFGTQQDPKKQESLGKSKRQEIKIP